MRDLEAENAQLRERAERSEAELHTAARALDKAEALNTRYREALEEIADLDWCDDAQPPGYDDVEMMRVARTALEDSEGSQT
jgi:hypothetical protein